MGMFSSLCRCGHPLLCSAAVDPEINEWMHTAVILKPNGSVLIGAYDGYGGVDGDECWDFIESDFIESDVWHFACWLKAGRPDFERQAPHAPDQGYFFDTGAHDMLDPRETFPEGELERRQALRKSRFEKLERSARFKDWIGIESREAKWRQRAFKAYVVAQGLDPIVFDEDKFFQLDEETMDKLHARYVEIVDAFVLERGI